MRSDARTDDAGSGAVDADVGAGEVEQTIPDDVADKLLRGVMIAMAAVVVVGLFAGAALWAIQGDDDPAAPMNAVDVGFLQDMIDHHEQALLISELYLENQPRGPAAGAANEVIMFQERDLGWMRDWLAEEGYAPCEPGRIAMEWMGEPTPVAEMPGMQTPERLRQLSDARGAEADRLFFEIMTDHHLGGVHMADHAAANGAREDVVEFAEATSRTQRYEVVEYRRMMERLGLT
jgi:uncharacterized protein (DUF305 family)